MVDIEMPLNTQRSRPDHALSTGGARTGDREPNRSHDLQLAQEQEARAGNRPRTHQPRQAASPAFGNLSRL